MDFKTLWSEMKKLASSGNDFKTIGEKRTFKTRVVGNKIEIDSHKAKDIHYITEESAKENYERYKSLPPSERYKTKYYYNSWNKVYVLRFFKELL